MRRGWLAGVALAALSAAGTGWSVAPHADAAGRVVRVGVYQNAPKIYMNGKGEPAGLFVTLIKAIARREGWHLEFVPCKWKSCLRRLQTGGIDLMPDVAFTDTRAKRFAFHDVPVAHAWSVILKRANTSPGALSDLDHQRVATLAGSVQTRALRKMMSGLGLTYTPVEYSSYARAYAAVRDGEVDAVASNSFYAAFYARKFGLRETPVVFDPVALYFAARKGDPLNLLPAIDARLESWRYDQHSIYYSALRTAMVPAQEPVVPPVLRHLLVAVGGLLVTFLIVSGMLRWQVRRRTRELRETAHRLDHMLRSSPVVLYHLAMHGGHVTTRWVSNNMERLFGFSADGFVERNRWPRQLHPGDRDAVLSNIASLPQIGHLVQEYRIVDAGGQLRSVRDEMQFLKGATGEPDEIVGSWNDLTESREQAERVSFLTYYDPLTRLPNNALLRERLTHAIHRARPERRALALLSIDIDRFKNINDSLGRSTGDIVLKEVARRLVQVLGAGENLSRTGGDGFVLFMEDDAGRHTAVDMTRKIMARFEEPVRIAGQDVTLTLSTGISLFPGDGEDADTLLQHAEAAMYEAKRGGRNAYQLYSASLSTGRAERLLLENALRSAPANGELVLHYQPQLDLSAMRPVSVEALVRWQHPVLGLVPPGQFIPLAEETGLIGDIGAWVLEEACRQVLAWRAREIPVPRVAVNLSVQQVDNETLIPLVRRVLEGTGLEAPSLELEVTESTIMRDPQKATSALSGLRTMGVRLAIDDFGTGYSSLSYLKHLPIDRLKIDSSFVRDIGSDANSRAICRAVIALARSLELEVVAEGVELAEQLDFLRREGCSVAQGFLFSRAVPAEELAAVWRTADSDVREAAPGDFAASPPP